LKIQAQYASQEDLKNAANEMFEEANYVGSIKLFSQLLSNYPKDANYNYKYGTCVLFGSNEKEKSLKYLTFAITKPNVDPVAYYFLAKAYHYNYDFSLAIKTYNKFKSKASSKELKKYKVDRAIVMCENGQQLIKSIGDIGVLSKIEIKESDFFRSYKLNGIGGKIIVKPDDFKTKYDLKANEKSLIYLGENKSMVVYSSYGKAGDTGKDIYRVIKLPSGEWSKPTLLSVIINTEFDEDYPFLHPDGRTLYFSSKGFNSMGGYDIFKSTLNDFGQWSYPENLDFPINTPGDDILYISDIENKLAYFASSRASKQGELTVYNVTVESTPSQHSIIKGFFLAESNPSIKKATITVKDVDNDRRYGVYNTNKVSGEYLLTFPSNGGKFKLLVETNDDAPVHSAIIDIPKLDGFRALKQELRLVGSGDEEKLVVKNLFDESDEFDFNDPLVVQNLLKQKAQLNVNTTKEELTKENTMSVYSDLTDDQIVNNAEKTASKIKTQTATSKKQVNSSYQIAKVKSTEAKALYKESKTLAENGKSVIAESKKFEAAQLINEVVAALALAKTIENEIVERETDLANVTSLEESINSKIDNGNRTDAEADIASLDKIASATYHMESALETEEAFIGKDLIEKQRVYNKDRDAITALKNRSIEITESIDNLETTKATTKRKKDLADLTLRIEALKIDAEDVEFDLERSRAKEIVSKKNYVAAINKNASSKSVILLLTESDGTAPTIEDSKKLQLENDVLYFEKEGLVGLYADEKAMNEIATLEILPETSNEFAEGANAKDNTEEYGIVDAEGEIIDYNAKYSSQLTAIANNSTEEQKPEVIMKINESWIKDIGDEITIRKKQISTELDLDKKTALEEQLTLLEGLKLEKQTEFIEMEELLANNNSITPETTSFNNEETSISADVDEDFNMMNTDGSLIDYDAQYAAELELLDDQEDFETVAHKSKIYKNWIAATEQEILIKKMELIEAETEEKKSVEDDLSVLENHLIEQKESGELYEKQARNLSASRGGDAENGTLNASNNEALASVTEIDPNEELTSSTEEVILEEDKEAVSNPFHEVYDGDDYQENYTSKLNLIGDEDTYENSLTKAIVHKNWATTIASTIAAKKLLKAKASGDKENEIANEIAILESDLIAQEEFEGLYQDQAEIMKPNEIIANELSNENSEEQISPTVSSGTREDNSAELISSSAEGTVANSLNELDKEEDYKEKYTSKLNLIGTEDNYANVTEKVGIHNNWATTIATILAEKKSLKAEASSEDQNQLANEISILESDLIEQEEFVGLYKDQAEMMDPLDAVVSNEPLTSIEEATPIQESIDSEELMNESANESANENDNASSTNKLNIKENFTSKLSLVGTENTYENSIQKVDIHKEWAKTIATILAEKKVLKAEASAAEAGAFTSEIARLESDLIEQEEFVGLFRDQAEMMAPLDAVVSNEPLASIEEATPIQESINSEELMNESGSELLSDSSNDS
jgi:hypothetical protein